MQTLFPVAGFVPASVAIPPYTYVNALKLDAKGRVVVSG